MLCFLCLLQDIEKRARRGVSGADFSEQGFARRMKSKMEQNQGQKLDGVARPSRRYRGNGNPKIRCSSIGRGHGLSEGYPLRDGVDG